MRSTETAPSPTESQEPQVRGIAGILGLNASAEVSERIGYSEGRGPL